MSFAGLLHQSVNGPAAAAGHGVNGLVDIFVVDKEWVDEIRGRERGLTDEGTDGGGLAVAARTDHLNLE